MWTMWMLAAPALAGDLWLTVEKAVDEQVTVQVPANWLLDEGDPVRLETERGAVDLRTEARQLKRGAATWTHRDAEGPVEITLAHREPTGEPATRVTLSGLGPLGRGLNLSFPLEADRLADSSAKLDGVVSIDGLQLDLDDAACSQLRRSPPTVLLEVVDDGHTFRIATD